MAIGMTIFTSICLLGIVIILLFLPIISLSTEARMMYNYGKLKKLKKLRAIKITKNDNTVEYEVQQKLKLCYLFPLYKWYSLSEREDKYASITQYDSLEKAENRIKELINKNIKKIKNNYNNTIKKVDVVLITK